MLKNKKFSKISLSKKKKFLPLRKPPRLKGKVQNLGIKPKRKKPKNLI
jgi:hypothetical protein